MDSFAEAADYDRMDHSTVNQLFVADFLDAARPLVEAAEDEPLSVLDLGVGTAQIPIELCRQSAHLKVVAVDLAVHMLDLARLKVEAAGLRDRVVLQLADAKSLPYADASFGAVISNSIVHHIPEPRSVLAETVRLVRTGGQIFVRDLLRPGDDAEVQRLVQHYAGDCNDRQQALFDASLRAALSLDEIRDIVQELGYDPKAVHATSDRHWTWSAVRT